MAVFDGGRWQCGAVKRWLAACLLAGLAGPAWSMDLLQAYDAAVSNDALFASARAQRQAGQEAVVQARAGLLPNVGLSASGGRNYAEVAGLGHHDYNDSSWGVQLTQPLFRMQNWIEAEQGELRVVYSDLGFELARQDLILRVAEAYFNVLNSQDALEAVTSLRQAAEEQLEISTTSFEVGTVTVTDVHEARSRSDLASAQVIAAESALEVSRHALAQIIGSAPAALAVLRPGVEMLLPVPNSQSAWVAAAEQGNFNVQLQSVSRDIADCEVSRARAGHLPTVDLVAGHGLSQRQSAFNTPRTESTALGIQLNMPLYTGGATSSYVRETAALKIKADADLESARRDAVLAVHQAYLGVSNGVAQVKALEAAELSSRSSLEANRLGYEVGVRINIDVLNAQSQLADTQRELARARYDTMLAQLRLKAAVGTLNEQDLRSVNGLLMH